MSTLEQSSDGNPNDTSGFSNVLGIILGGVIPGCAILTVILIFLVWCTSGCLEPARPTGENDNDEVLPECPKYSGAPRREQGHEPPAYEAGPSRSGLTTDCWADDRTICSGESNCSPSQDRADSRHPTTLDPSVSSDTTCLNSKASSIRDASGSEAGSVEVNGTSGRTPATATT
ncbi:hypothetical protein J7T55_003649 [Diaporthe amygdali]|uniref:uncharacterized protein n=1 Tax=Phomopsis amygdali TaxID=1214568 RepID=UPI0022FDC749|nr:uncharacterized protein J7T55_003649 [Diaporthe amygdali]KAJ0117239.1 hypothetical protein J7T55_003649 [Diaporthe amygdali]